MYPDGVTSRDITAVNAHNALLQVANEVLQQVNVQFSSFGITQARFRMLILLLRHAGRTGLKPCQLADMMKVERATITGILDGLERDGLVRRVKFLQDRRAVNVRLLPKGRALIKKVAPPKGRQMARLMRCLTSAECGTLTRLLEKIEKRLAEINE